MLAKAAIKNLPQMKMRAEKSDGDLDYEENFYILKHTACPPDFINASPIFV